MKITEIRIRLVDSDNDRKKLRAFCSITLDNSFVIRDIKILEGNQGLFVAMPTRKFSFHCPHCSRTNHISAVYCNFCGERLPRERPYPELANCPPSRQYLDIAHPISAKCREYIHVALITAYQEEKERSLLPGYVSSYDDYFDN